MSTGLVANILAQFLCNGGYCKHYYHCWLLLPLFLGCHQDLENYNILQVKNAFEKFILWFEKQLDNFTHWITGLLEWSLRTTFRRVFTVVITFVVLILSFMLVKFGFIGSEFFPENRPWTVLGSNGIAKRCNHREKQNQITLEVEKF